MISEMTLHEVAEELGLHYMTVYRYVRLGYLPAHKQGGSWRVLRTDFEELRKAPPAEARRGQPSSPWDQRLLQRLLAADQNGAWKVVQAARTSGMSPGTIYREMILPVMRELGDAWHRETISIGQEHAATQIVTRIVSRLSAEVARRGVPKGLVVIGTTATDLHTLPVMIAADLMRLEGFEVLDLGSRLPAESFAEIVSSQQRLVAVAVSVTSPGQAEEIRATVAALRDRVDVPIILGGAAIDGDEHAKLLGADMGGRNIDDILPRLIELVA